MQKKFTATLRSFNESNLGWKVIDIPFDVKKVFGSGARIPVKGTVNGFEFRTSLFPVGEGQHFMMLNKKMQKGAGVEVGDKVEVIIEHDAEERTVEMPDVLKRALAEEKVLLKYFRKFNYSMQKYIADWTTEPKSFEAQERRAEQMAEVLMETMEGEEIPPPIFQQYLMRSPKAQHGWNTMPESHRRQHLFAIAWLRSPEAKEKRMKRAIEEIIKYSEKPASKTTKETTSKPAAQKATTKAKAKK